MSTHHDKIKVNKPEPFDGDRSKYRSFMISTSLYLATVPNLSDGERIAFVLSYLTTGHALMWRDRFVEQDMKKVTVFEDFNNLLDLTFKDTNAEAKAALKLRQLKQKTKTCDEYTAEFKALAAEAGIVGDTSLIQFYQDGLNSPLLDRCWGIIPTPLTLEGWISNASQLDLAYRHRQAQKQGITSTFRRPSNRDSNAMDVDRKKSDGIRLRKLTPDERKKMIEEGRCFACREKGHLSSQCPKKEHGGTRKATTKGKMRTVKEDDEISSRSSSPPPPPLPPKSCKATKPSTSTHCTTTEEEEE